MTKSTVFMNILSSRLTRCSRPKLQLGRYLGISALGLAIACGGGGDTSSVSAPSQTTIEGTVFASPVSGSQVSIRNEQGDILAGPVSSDASGNYQLRLSPSMNQQALSLVAQGGRFVDEATGENVELDELSLHMAANTIPQQSELLVLSPTPFTSLEHQLVKEGMVQQSAKDLIANTFGYQVNPSVKPKNVTQTKLSAGDRRDASLAAANWSQTVKDLGIAPQYQMEAIRALAKDLKDQKLDGIQQGNVQLPSNLGQRYAQAVLNFHQSGNNQSGGLLQPPFLKTQTSLSKHKISWVSSVQMGVDQGALVGASNLMFRVEDEQGQALDQLTQIKVTPVMSMVAGHVHGTPMSKVKNLGSGNYGVEIFYLMMSGPEMGVWKIAVDLGLEDSDRDAVAFFPDVSMNMRRPQARLTFSGNAQLGNDHDSIKNMMGQIQGRPYYVFPKDLTAVADGYRLDLFVSSRSTMMLYPNITNGLGLSQADGTTWTVGDVQLTLQEPGGEVVRAQDLGDGHFRADFSKLSQASSPQWLVGLSINGIAKTVGGNTHMSLQLSSGVTP